MVLSRLVDGIFFLQKILIAKIATDFLILSVLILI